jgi:hypothetical protein
VDEETFNEGRASSVLITIGDLRFTIAIETQKPLEKSGGFLPKETSKNSNGRCDYSIVMLTAMTLSNC